MKVLLKAATLVLIASAIVAAFAIRKTSRTPALEIAYGPRGLQSLSFQNVPLENLASDPSDAFHIWHMKMTDLKGNGLSSGQYGWGELNQARTWDSGRHTWTYLFTWGSIAVRYTQSGSMLNMNVTVKNNPNSGVIFYGATIYPIALHFPILPKGFHSPKDPQLALNTVGPSATLADFGTGAAASVATDYKRPLITGFQPSAAPLSYTAIVSSTALDGMPQFAAKQERPVMPGASESFTVSLRFAASGTPVAILASDAMEAWAKAWPATIHWPDRRIIGTIYLATSPQEGPHSANRILQNPRNYHGNLVDIRTPAGIRDFQRSILKIAYESVQNLMRLKAQGAITWDIEGEEYPQPTTYICAPDRIGEISPEMESVIGDASSPYSGMKLADAYFKVIRDAGFTVGVCVRPQHLTIGPNGNVSQQYLPDDQVASELKRKMAYAHERWNARIFYIDSNVTKYGRPLDAAIFEQLAAAFPDSLLIPEHWTDQYYAYTAPFMTFIFHGDLGTQSTIRSMYPQAFSVNMVNDVDPAKLAAHRLDLIDSVRHGDILMVHADYWQANNQPVVTMYRLAQASR